MEFRKVKKKRQLKCDYLEQGKHATSTIHALHFGLISQKNLNFKIQISLTDVLGFWISFLFHMYFIKNKK